MTYEIYPVKIEAFDEIQDLAFKLTTQDSVCAAIEILTPVNSENWPNLSNAIHRALGMMRLNEASESKKEYP